MRRAAIAMPLFLCIYSLLSLVAPLPAQNKMDGISLERARGILRDAYLEVKKHYYDPSCHGIDLEARYKKYSADMETATSMGDAFTIVFQFLDGLNDSHTFFRPPSRAFRLEYGFRTQVFGDKVLVTQVRPGTEAVGKVFPGDEVIRYNGFTVARDTLWKMEYYLNQISPRPESQLILRDPVGNVRQLAVNTKVQPLKRVLDLTASRSGDDIMQMIRDQENASQMMKQRYFELGDVMIWKMPEFFLNDGEVDHMFWIARKHKSLILDLRGNPGGLITTLERMVGNVFDHDIKISDRIGRKEMKPQLAKSVGNRAFAGELIVLTDSNSASAAELFARVVQLENRGKVIGDRSSGSVMEARGYVDSQGADTKFFYIFSVTDADLRMKDGKSLEHNGVIPDEIVLPTPMDLKEGRDPVLARAVELAGLKLDPAAAGKLFPFEWMPL